MIYYDIAYIFEWFLLFQAVVHETPSIKKGYLSESSEPGEKGLWRLKTDGVNLQVLWRYADVLNLKQAYTNNIHAMANAYGIEAACKTIIKVSGFTYCTCICWGICT